MSEDSCPPPPVPLATWNPARGVWETAQASLLCEHSVPYSAPWPTSGSMHAGACFAPPTSEPPITEHGFSSSLGHPDGLPLLKTPTSNLATNGGSQHPSKRKQGGHGPNLADEVEWLLPTSAARLSHLSGGKGMRTGRGRKGPVGEASLTEVLSLFADAEAGPGSGGRTAPPSPDGRRSPAPRRGRPMTRAA